MTRLALTHLVQAFEQPGGKAEGERCGLDCRTADHSKKGLNVRMTQHSVFVQSINQN
jgi:hypothetical protein